MKKSVLRLGAIFLAFLLSFCSLPAIYAADSESETPKRIYGEIISYLSSRAGANTLEELRDSYIIPNAGEGSEWYALALAQSSELDLADYSEALSRYVAKNGSGVAVTKQKYALCLGAAGSSDPYILSVLESTVGKGGLMSYVWGLHLLNNGYESASHTHDSVIGALTERQRADGGWSVMGENGDADATAMVLQALAPSYESNETVRAAVDKGLVFLSNAQLSDGGFTSFGVSNPESAAQAVIALSALGIDCFTDQRFIKNGNNLFDVILRYRTNNGGYSHTLNGEESVMAISQIFCAATAYIRMTDGGGSLYILDRKAPIDQAAPPSPDISDDKSGPSGENSVHPSNGTDGKNRKTSSVLPKLILAVAVLGAGGVACLIIYLRGKRRFNRYIIPIVLTALALLFIFFADIKSAGDYYGGESKGEPIGNVTLTVRCDSISEAGKDYIPSDGFILRDCVLPLYEGDTAYELLLRAARENQFQIDVSGSGESAYVRGINYIYEFDFGDLSGWTYLVNRERPSRGCGTYILADGDRVEWIYSLESGRDIE